MIENQNFVKHILVMVGLDNVVDVDVDSSYNNPPQSEYEATTQTICPLAQFLNYR